MGRFVSRRQFQLDFLGDEWKDCYIRFSSLTVKEVRELAAQKVETKTDVEVSELTSKLLREHFIEGVGYDDDKKDKVKLVPEDMDDFPSVFTEAATLFLISGRI